MSRIITADPAQLRQIMDIHNTAEALIEVMKLDQHIRSARQQPGLRIRRQQ